MNSSKNSKKQDPDSVGPLMSQKAGMDPRP